MTVIQLVKGYMSNFVQLRLGLGYSTLSFHDARSFSHILTLASLLSLHPAE